MKAIVASYAQTAADIADLVKAEGLKNCILDQYYLELNASTTQLTYYIFE